MNEKEHKLAILTSNKESHKSSMLSNDINIGIYTSALNKIDAGIYNDPEISVFRSYIKDLITNEMRQKIKTQVLLDAVEDQIQKLGDIP